MRNSLLALALMATVASAAPPSKPGGCPTGQADIPVKWTIETTSGIWGDSGTPTDYQNGVSGVQAVINECSGSHDATLLLSNNRTVKMSLNSYLKWNDDTPGWAKSTDTNTVDLGFLNVRSLNYVPDGKTRQNEYTFTTRFGAGSSAGSFVMLNPAVEAPQAKDTCPNCAEANKDYTNSLVIVEHHPAAGGTPEHWIVYPEPNPTVDITDPVSGAVLSLGGQNDVGALLVDKTVKVGKKTTTMSVNGGTFRVPFKFIITSLQ